MKFVKISIKIIFLGVFIYFVFSQCAKPQLVKQPEIKTIKIESKGYHLGDSDDEDFTRVKPDGLNYSKSFKLDKLGKEIKLVVISSQLTTKVVEGNDYNKSFLYVNGEKIACLNDKVSDSNSTDKVTHTYPLDKKILKTGKNTISIKIIPKKKHIDDFEIHKIELKLKMPVAAPAGK